MNRNEEKIISALSEKLGYDLTEYEGAYHHFYDLKTATPCTFDEIMSHIIRVIKSKDKSSYIVGGDTLVAKFDDMVVILSGQNNMMIVLEAS